jgi:hypothetical protein
MLVITTMGVTGCSDDEKQQQLLAKQNQQFQQQQYAPQIPQAVQQPPVIINNSQPQQQDSTFTNLAAGAALGAVAANLANNNDNNRVIEKHYIENPHNTIPHKSYFQQPQNVPISNTQQLNSAQSQTVPPTPAKVEKNYMDTNKLADSAKYSPQHNNSSPLGATLNKSVTRSSGMNMSKLAQSTRKK